MDGVMKCGKRRREVERGGGKVGAAAGNRSCNRNNARRRGIYRPVKRKGGMYVDNHEASIHLHHELITKLSGPRRHWERIVYVQ